eukprot:g775.t1
MLSMVFIITIIGLLTSTIPTLAKLPATSSIERLGSVDLGILAETTPIVWRGDLWLMECIQGKKYYGNVNGESYIRFTNPFTGKRSPHFAIGYGLGNAVVEEGVVYVYATKTPYGISTNNTEVSVFWSKDIMSPSSWNSSVAIRANDKGVIPENCSGRKGLWNTCVQKGIVNGKETFIMAYEYNCGNPGWQTHFAIGKPSLSGENTSEEVSTSLESYHWEPIPYENEHDFVNISHANPTIRYNTLDKYWYLLSTRGANGTYVEDIYRAKNPLDFSSWEAPTGWSIKNLFAAPLLAPSAEDQIVSPANWHPDTKAVVEGEKTAVKDAKNINTSDLDLCTAVIDGVISTVLYWAWGDQELGPTAMVLAVGIVKEPSADFGEPSAAFTPVSIDDEIEHIKDLLAVDSSPSLLDGAHSDVESSDSSFISNKEEANAVLNEYGADETYAMASHCYQDGHLRSAFLLFQAAASEPYNHIQASYSYASMLIQNLGIKSANLSGSMSSDGLDNGSSSSSSGASVKKKRQEKAVRIFQSLAKAGHPYAQFNLAQCYYLGVGMLEPNYIEAYNLFQLSAENGISAAYFHIANAHSLDLVPLKEEEDEELHNHHDGSNDTEEKNEDDENVRKARQQRQAIKFYQKGADLGCPFSALQLGIRYFRSKGGVNENGVDQDWEQAFKFHSQAAGIFDNVAMEREREMADFDDFVSSPAQEKPKGIPQAIYNVGIHYFTGKGVGYDPQKAVYYFRVAAEYNFVMAMVNLGNLLASGRKNIDNTNKSVDIDREEAERWLRKASQEYGNELASQLLTLHDMHTHDESH